MRDGDHLEPPAGDLRTAFLEHLRSEGEDPTGWRITLVANPRVLGYVFNPASFFLCRDIAGELRVVVVEVHNTHGERHVYTLRPRPGAPAFVASMEKAFYVSPFIETGGGYTVRVRDDASRLRISINHELPDGLVLHASLDLVRRPLTDRNLLRMLLRHPFVTHRTTLLIHWHALRLWLPRGPIPPTSSGRSVTVPIVSTRRPVVLGSMLERVAWRVGLAAADRLRYGRLMVVLPDGTRRVFGEDAAADRAEIHLHDATRPRPDARPRRDRRR